jgi:ubiquinone/menaquinone biosynthesis C-methylase UbiE
MSDGDTLSYEPGALPVLRSKEETRAFYDKPAKAYDLLSEHTEQPMCEAGLELFRAAPAETVLEIGFGTGHCLVELARTVGAEGKCWGSICRRTCSPRWKRC